MSLNRPKRILLVEDNPADVRLLEEAFKQSTDPLELHAVQNGEEALDFIYRRDGHSDKPRPDLILLDINLPTISGHQVLHILKNDVRFRRIPVLMLSSSRLTTDVRTAYENHANAYLQKPGNLREYRQLVSELSRFWLWVVALPEAPD